MRKVQTHIKNTKNILLVFLVLFSLSSCIAKETFFDLANIEYFKPLNKSATLLQKVDCQNSVTKNQKIAVAKQAKIDKKNEVLTTFTARSFVVLAFKIHPKYVHACLGNVPPKYIFFKRLKLDLV